MYSKLRAVAARRDSSGSDVRQFSMVLRGMRPSVLAGMSQGLGLLQLLLLLQGVGAGPESDAFFLIFGWGQLPTQIILLGVLYPLWLRKAYVSVATQRSFILLAGIGGAIFSVGSAVFLVMLDKGYPSIWLHASILAAFSFCSACGWAFSLHTASRGNADWLSSVSLLPSLFACAVLMALVREDLSLRVTGLAGGFLAGSLGFLLILHRSGLTRLPVVEAASPIGGVDRDRGSIWFGLKSTTGYGAAMLMQSVTATLPATALTLVGVVSRVVGGFSTIVTNTILPRLVHSESNSADAGLKYGWISVAISSGIGSIAIAGGLVFGSEFWAYALIACAWICASSLSASVQRVALRFLPPRYSLVSIVVAFGVPTALVVATVLGASSLAVVLCSFVLLDLAIAVILCVLLGKRLLAICAVMACAFLLATGILLLDFA